LTCPDCGIKFMEFRAGGQLGCPQDYRVFSAGPALGAAVSRCDPACGQGGTPSRGVRPSAPAPHSVARGDRP
jgi:hypothetical protein